MGCVKPDPDLIQQWRARGPIGDTISLSSGSATHNRALHIIMLHASPALIRFPHIFVFYFSSRHSVGFARTSASTARAALGGSLLMISSHSIPG
jgi:hypothetical protein